MYTNPLEMATSDNDDPEEKTTYCNAQMAPKPKMIRKHCAINADGEKLLENAVARAHDRILKVARTIADLDASENISASIRARRFSTGRSTGIIGLNPGGQTAPLTYLRALCYA